MTQIRAKNLIALIKFKIKNNIKKVKTLIIIICVVIIVISFIPRNLKIYFIDVGQGDSTLIVTPHNKTILIDGGGSEKSWNYFRETQKCYLPKNTLSVTGLIL